MRRAYRQISRLIVNEGFKDFAKLCGFDPNDSNYQDVRAAYDDIQSNQKLKQYYKSKMAKDGINISNLDQALYKSSSSDEAVSPVEKFLSDYQIYSASYEQYFKDETAKRRLEKSSTEYLLDKQKQKDARLKEAFAGNVVQETSQYIVYEARTFEEANQMRWMWVGDVLKMSNEECKKLDPNAPGDAEPYKGKMSSQQMAGYMMSNNEFIMNPSWCVCAGEEHWDDYKCGETNDDGSASCHLIFSKKFPNCRFCVVRNPYNFEIRDPWQAGDFSLGKNVQYGYEVMRAVFGDAVKQIECLHGVVQKIVATQLKNGLDKNEVGKVEQMLEQGLLEHDFDPNYKENGVPLITYAVRYGTAKICKLLLEYGADVNIKSIYRDTLLHQAASGGDTEICKMLLDVGMDANAEDNKGVTPLHSAARNGHTEICKMLLDIGVDANVKNEYGDTPINNAVENGHAETCQLLLERGAKVNADFALLQAARGGHTELCKLMLERGADVDVKDEHGLTPLHDAARNGYTETCQLLLNYGADIYSRDKHGQTSLILAAACGYADTCKLLLDNGAGANTEDCGSSLLWAAENGHTEVCKLMIANGADVNVKSEDGRTPLHWVAENNHVETCKLLLMRGADANVKDMDGDTPLQIAMDYSHTTICELLLRRFRERYEVFSFANETEKSD